MGIAYTSAWFPQRLQGTALGIFGAGNNGASLTKLFAPALMTVVPAGGLGLIPGGWRFVPFVYAIVLLITAAICWSFTFTDHSHHKAESVRQLLSPLKHMGVWRFSLYYFLVFGGYVALSLWLPKYYIDVFGLPLQEAALLTAIFVFPSGIIRAPGGWLSDRYGARTVMYWVLSVCVVSSFLLMFPDVDLGFIVPARYAGQGAGPRLSLRMGPYLFTVIVFVLGIAMGIGKAAVFKHIPHYLPDKVGSVGGLVGVIGGLGGFVMPILFEAMTQATRLPPRPSPSLSRSSSRSMSRGGRSLDSTTWCSCARNCVTSRSSSAWVSNRWARNWTSSIRITSTSANRLRKASPCPAATAA